MRQPSSLYFRTSLTIFIALFIFLLFAAIVVFINLVQPIARQAAGDMAALLTLSAQTWVELPVEARPRFETELKNYHTILISRKNNTLQSAGSHHPYINYLQESLEERLEQKITILEEKTDSWNFWIDLRISGQVIRIGFPRQRIGPSPPIVVFLLLSGAAILIFLTSNLLVKRLIKPLEKLSQATLKMGRDTRVAPLKESGARELTLLTRSFNQMNQRVQQLLDNRTTLLAGISHDLRTPVSRIHLALELMENKCDQELSDGIRYDLIEIDKLLEQTLELASSRKKALDKLQRVDLNKIISVEVNKFKAQYKHIEWEEKLSYYAAIAPTALQRIIQNLLHNAIRYGDNKPVKIELASTPEQIRIYIIDQGTGIPEEYHNSIFQPFFRMETSRNTDTGGSGLGLAIVSQLCEVYGWRISLKTNENKGCTFCLTIDNNYL